MLTLMYIAFAVIGCGYVLFAGFLGHFGPEGAGAHDHAHHTSSESYGLDAKGHGAATAGDGPGAFHFPFFSPLALATLVAAVGGFGLIAQHGFGAGEGMSLLIALPAALVTSYAVTYAGWKLASGSRASSVIKLDRLTGARGEVTVPIPENGVGEAVVFPEGHRYSGPARSESGAPLARGASIVVAEMLGSTLIVRSAAAPSPPSPERSTPA